MELFKIISSFVAGFRQQDAGAVTTDFVVLTASLIGIAVLVLGSVSDGTTTLAASIETTLEDR